MSSFFFPFQEEAVLSSAVIRLKGLRSIFVYPPSHRSHPPNSSVQYQSADKHGGIFDVSSSVADPGCLSRIPDPDLYPSRIPDLGSRIQKQQQKREVKKISCHTFLFSHKIHKIVNYFSFEVLKQKNLGQFSKNYRTSYQKICQKALKNMVLGSGIRDPEKTYSGSRI